MANLLNQVREGMHVVDSTGDKVGTVEQFKLTDEDPDTTAAEQVTHESGMRPRDTFLDGLADVFHADEVPEEIRENLLRRGFIRVDSAGLFASDKYVFPEQIASVHDDTVALKVTREDLIRRDW